MMPEATLRILTNTGGTNVLAEIIDSCHGIKDEGAMSVAEAWCPSSDDLRQDGPKTTEALAHLVDDFRQRCRGVASAGAQGSFV